MKKKIKMSSIQGNIPIDKLTSDNYQTWSTDVKFLLIQIDAWDIITGTEKIPNLEDKSITKSDVRDFERRSRNALSIIYLNVSNEFKVLIDSCEKPKEAWSLLKAQFQPNNRSRHMQLFTELCNCRIVHNEPISLFSARIRKISEQLNGIGQAIAETLLIFQLIRYLPAEYDMVVQSILRWSDDKFKFKDIQTELITEEARLAVRDQDRLNGSYETQLSKVRFSRPKTVQQQKSEPKAKSLSPRKRHTSSPSRSKSPGQVTFQRTDRRRYRNKAKNFPTETHYLCESYYTHFGKVNEWVFDTASTHHFCKDRHLFESLEPVRDKQLSVAVRGKSIPIEYRGVVNLKFETGFQQKFERVLYVPTLRKNILSGSLLDLEGKAYCGGRGKVDVFLRENMKSKIFTARLEKGIYYIPTVNSKPEENPKSILKHQERKFQPKRKPKVKRSNPPRTNLKPKLSNTESTQIKQNDLMKVWHERLGHMSPELISHSSSNDCLRGIPTINKKKFYCEDCKLNKTKRISFKPIGGVRTEQPLDLLHLDLWGPAPVKGQNGERYYLSITDDFSRKITIYPLKSKAETFSVFLNHVTRAERFLDTKLKAIQTDNGGEFVNSQFQKYARETGVRHSFTDIYSPEMNGIAERVNQTIGNTLRTILSSSCVPKVFWPEAVLYAAYCWNRICRRSKSKTPFELYGGNKPSVKHLKPFGSVCFVGVPKQRRSKFDQRAKKGILVGYACRIKGYRVLFPETGKIVESRNVTFAEDLTNYYQDQVGESSRANSGAVLGNHSQNIYTLQEPEAEEMEIPHLNLGPAPSTSKATQQTRSDPVSNSDDDSSPDQVTTDDSESPNLRNTRWERRPVTRPDKSRTDIYYYEVGKTTRLRSHHDVKKYCSKNNLTYRPDIFNFRGTDLTAGIISSQDTESQPEDEVENEDPDLLFSEYVFEDESE